MENSFFYSQLFNKIVQLWVLLARATGKKKVVKYTYSSQVVKYTYS